MEKDKQHSKKEVIKKLKILINKYYNLLDKEDFDGIDKLCSDDGIFETCVDIVKDCAGIEIFETKGFSSTGYDLQSYVFAWTNDKNQPDGITLDVESW